MIFTSDNTKGFEIYVAGDSFHINVVQLHTDWSEVFVSVREFDSFISLTSTHTHTHGYKISLLFTLFSLVYTKYIHLIHIPYRQKKVFLPASERQQTQEGNSERILFFFFLFCYSDRTPDFLLFFCLPFSFRAWNCDL